MSWAQARLGTTSYWRLSRALGGNQEDNIDRLKQLCSKTGNPTEEQEEEKVIITSLATSVRTRHQELKKFIYDNDITGGLVKDEDIMALQACCAVIQYW